MGETATLMTAITALVIAVGSGLGWLIKRHDDQKPSLSRQAADIAAANEVVDGALRIVQKNLTIEIERLQAGLKAARDELEEHRARNEKLLEEHRKESEKLRIAVNELRQDRNRDRADLDVLVEAVWEQSQWNGEGARPAIAQAALEVVHRRRQEVAGQQTDAISD